MPMDAFYDDLDSLRELVSQLSSERDAAVAECKRVTKQNDRLRHLLQQLRRAQFGRKSERLDPEQLQLAIEDLETAVAAEAAEQHKTAPIEKAPKKKRKTNRGSLPAHLRVHITLAPDSTACPQQGRFIYLAYASKVSKKTRKHRRLMARRSSLAMMM